MLFSPHSHRSHTLLGRRATAFPGILRVRLRNILEDIEVGTISLEVVPVPKLEEGATDCVTDRRCTRTWARLRKDRH